MNNILGMKGSAHPIFKEHRPRPRPQSSVDIRSKMNDLLMYNNEVDPYSI